MPRLLIVYHSKTGGTAQMARAAFQAADKEETEALLVQAENAGPDELLAADGYLFAAPENLAAIAGVMKDFYDRSYYPVLGKLEGRPYAQMVCAGSGRARGPPQHIAEAVRDAVVIAVVSAFFQDAV